MIPVLKHQWHVNEYLNSLQTSFVFLGFLCGSMVSGYFADKYGRRLPFLFSTGLNCLVMLLTAIC